MPRIIMSMSWPWLLVILATTMIVQVVEASAAAQMVQRINETLRQGKKPLCLHEKASAIATRYAETLKISGKLNHNADGMEPRERYAGIGQYIGENVFKGSDSGEPDVPLDDGLEEHGTKGYLTDDGATHIGIGSAAMTDKAGKEMVIWVQVILKTDEPCPPKDEEKPKNIVDQLAGADKKTEDIKNDQPPTQPPAPAQPQQQQPLPAAPPAAPPAGSQNPAAGGAQNANQGGGAQNAASGASPPGGGLFPPPGAAPPAAAAVPVVMIPASALPFPIVPMAPPAAVPAPPPPPPPAPPSQSNAPQEKRINRPPPIDDKSEGPQPAKRSPSVKLPEAPPQPPPEPACPCACGAPVNPKPKQPVTFPEGTTIRREKIDLDTAVKLDESGVTNKDASGGPARLSGLP